MYYSMKTNTIVTMSDKNYFDLLQELIHSIKRHQESQNISICILDAGLSAEQVKVLEEQVDSIKKAEWNIKVPNYKIYGKEWLKSQVSRAFLPKYFPEYEKYLWLDCDAWVNSWDAVNLYFKACENGTLGITQSIGPGYRNLARVNWIFNRIAMIKTQNYKHAKKSGFSESIARKIAFAPHLNIGVFSLSKNSKIWEIWQTILEKSLKKGPIFGSEGLAMNIAVYANEVSTEFLPLTCNWIASHVLPKFDEEKKTFVEPYLPNKPIGIMHLAAGIWKNGVDMRQDKNQTIELMTIKKKKINKSLRYTQS